MRKSHFDIFENSSISEPVTILYIASRGNPTSTSTWREQTIRGLTWKIKPLKHH